jgi:hypothetical protein
VLAEPHALAVGAMHSRTVPGRLRVTYAKTVGWSANKRLHHHRLAEFVPRKGTQIGGGIKCRFFTKRRSAKKRAQAHSTAVRYLSQNRLASRRPATNVNILILTRKRSDFGESWTPPSYTTNDVEFQWLHPFRPVETRTVRV